MTNPSTEAREAAPVQSKPGDIATIPWSLHLRAYEAYCKKFAPQPALLQGNCRGGFHTDELDMLVPGWRAALSIKVGETKL